MFEVGDVVVCVFAGDGPRFRKPGHTYTAWTWPLTEGKEYTVTWVGTHSDGEPDCVCVAGVREGRDPKSSSFNPSRFRKITPPIVEWAREVCRTIGDKRPVRA